MKTRFYMVIDGSFETDGPFAIGEELREAVDFTLTYSSKGYSVRLATPEELLTAHRFYKNAAHKLLEDKTLTSLEVMNVANMLAKASELLAAYEEVA